ncbi:DUF4263 domain-containing protein [Larkinella knui]|uniref:DUF4263 domain-containing protein n=1 Tax=Larkinella knui TaxID=2025310 RepID=A0A3P1CXK9_9BACT|nr:Shedu immune nuclease family protein [Larkinella knui]RRB18167.1 DUF4263 domain-containing protein [Larkinella knui]
MESTHSKDQEEKRFFETRIYGRIYISKRFEDLYSEKKKRFAYKITQSEQQERFVREKGEVILSVSNGGKHQLKALIIEDDDRIDSLVVQTFSAESGNPHKNGYSFRGQEVNNLYLFLKGLNELDLENENSFKIDDSSLKKLLIDSEQATRIVIENQDLIIDALKNNVTKTDIVALGYRKSQLNIFKLLLEDEAFFISEKEKLNKGDEAVWQSFFERNTWILGYGLDYIINTPLDNKKLEQVVSGYSISSSGKRADALLKTKGIVNALGFCEIKTHRTTLLKQISTPYRSSCWAISEELAGSISQSQRTVHQSILNIRTCLRLTDDEDNLTGETAYIYNPKSYVIIGSLSEFITIKGANEAKYSSFEMYRRNTKSPEIITFDELYERASYIVGHSM